MYPFAITFTSSREMMMVRMTRHPRFEWVDRAVNLNTKILFPAHISPKFAAAEIETRLLPRIAVKTHELLDSGKLMQSGQMPYGESDVGL